MEKAGAPPSSTLAWKIPLAEEPGRLQSMGSLSRTRLSDFPFTFYFHALEKAMATHSSTLAWKIPWTEEPGRLQSMGSQSRIRLKRLSSSSSKKGTTEDQMADGIPVLTDMSLSKLPKLVIKREAWPAAVHGVTKSQTLLSE